MRNKIRTIRDWLPTLAAVSLAAISVVMPHDALKDVTGEIVTFVSFVCAGATTAMAVSASVLSGEGMAPDMVERYSLAINEQFGLWKVFVYLCVICATCAIAGKVINWEIFEVNFSFANQRVSYELAKILNFAILFCGFIFVFKLNEFINALRRLVIVHNEFATARAESSKPPAVDKPVQVSLPIRQNFGEIRKAGE